MNFDKGKYRDKILDELFSNLNSCCSLEIPIYLKTIEMILIKEGNALNLYKLIINLIEGKIASYNYKEYFDLISYIDFILDFHMIDRKYIESYTKKCKKIIEGMIKILNNNKTFIEPILLFRDNTTSLSKNKSALLSLIQRTRIQRTEMLKILLKSINEKADEKGKIIYNLEEMQNMIKIGSKVDVYRY